MLDGLRAVPLIRIVGGGGDCITEQQIAASVLAEKLLASFPVL